jgi:hypothetical protein
VLACAQTSHRRDSEKRKCQRIGSEFYFLSALTDVGYPLGNELGKLGLWVETMPERCFGMLVVRKVGIDVWRGIVW